MADLPNGTVTFLFTDIEGSTRLWEQHPAGMRQALVRHDAQIEALVEANGGTLVRPRGEGDSRFAVFLRASDALSAACSIQLAFVHESGPLPEPLRVRIALHTGEADVREGDYYGTAVNRCARLRAVAHGGQTVLSGATAGLVNQLPQGVTLRDLGTHRLKDLGQAERVYQLLHPDLPATFPPLNSLDVKRTNLPLQATSFVGREREISEIRRLLDGVPLVTLTGPAGAGKSRLALHMAADLVDDFGDGVWLAELAALADGGLVLRAVALAVGVIEEPGRPLLQTLLESLSSKRAVLLLDNCDRVVRACAILTEAVMRTCPGLRILATSRESLGLAGEVAWTVPSLTLPGSTATWESVRATEAARLFIDRAAAARPGFALTDMNYSAVGDICRRLDGMPLAIELAAARVRILSPGQIAERLQNRFNLLTGGSRTAPTRQQTLRGAIDWSYDLLSAAEQALFARLSVFVGGFDLDAAEVVCILPPTREELDQIEASAVLNLLSQLVDKSLVVAEPTPRGGPVRYRLLDSLREYARERLDQRDEAASAQHQHARQYVRYAILAEPHLTGPDQADWLDRLEADHDNLLAALEWTSRTGQIESGLVLANGIRHFWLTRHPREGSEWLMRLLSLPGAVDPEIRAGVLNAAGNLAHAQGDLQQGAALHEASVTLRRSLGETRALAVALNSLGSVLMELGDYARGRANLEESLELRRQLGEPRAIAVVLVNLAELARRSGDLSRAASLGRESLALARSVGDDTVVATALNNLGSVAIARGDYDEAAILLGDAVMIFHILGNLRVVAECCQRLAELACFGGHGTLAASLLGASSALRETVGSGYLPAERAEYARGAAAARRAVGEDMYEVAWHEGHAGPWEGVLATALDKLLRGRPASSTPTSSTRLNQAHGTSVSA